MTSARGNIATHRDFANAKLEASNCEMLSGLGRSLDSSDQRERIYRERTLPSPFTSRFPRRGTGGGYCGPGACALPLQNQSPAGFTPTRSWGETEPEPFAFGTEAIVRQATYRQAGCPGRMPGSPIARRRRSVRGREGAEGGRHSRRERSGAWSTWPAWRRRLSAKT